MTAEIRSQRIRTSLSALSRRYRPALISFFLRRVRNHADAEDLTHDVLLRMASAEDEQEIARLDAYVFQTAANALRDRFRRDLTRHAALSRVPTSDAGDDVAGPDRILAGEQSLATVVRSLNELPARTRSIFTLYRLEGMSRPEIADLLAISVSSVEKHIMRATLHLRARLTGEELQ